MNLQIPGGLQIPGSASRRDFLKHTGGLAAAATILSASARNVHAAEDNTIRVALVGCGGRGTGAAADALNVQNGPLQLVALADVQAGNVSGSFNNLSGRFGAKVNVPEERRFVGFDSYKQAMDVLKPGDVVILGTPPVFRWVHFRYALDKGINVFMEKPVSVDAPTSVKMFEMGKESVAKNQKVAVGLMCRHCRSRGELFKRIKDGAIGDLTTMRAYRMAGPTGTAFSTRKPDTEPSELMWQVKRFHSWLWLSGGGYSDFLIHNIDECCWMKDAWPVSAQSTGGRHYRGDYVDQNFDNYSTEFTFADGAKLFLYGRTMDGCYNTHASLAHGTKGSAIISESGHMPSRCRTFKNQDMSDANITWRCADPEPNPYQTEWDDFIAAIREDRPYNETERGTEASLQSVLGRMAAHTGRVVTRDELLKLNHEFAPGVDELTMESPAPLLADADGKYPIPQPGRVTDREY
jgi:predicted dehydrogenase